MFGFPIFVVQLKKKLETIVVIKWAIAYSKELYLICQLERATLQKQ